MIKNIILITAVFFTFSFVYSQNEDANYMRSSLSMIMIETDEFPSKEKVLSSWNNYPFPDKYNEHDIKTKKINVSSITLTDEDLKSEGLLKDTLKAFGIIKAAGKGAPLRYLNNEQTLAFALPTKKQDVQFKINKVLREEKVANQLVKTWFGMGDGKWDLNLMNERGQYDLSEFEANVAKGQADANAVISNAGEQLIANTFVTFTALEFVENEPIARAVKEAADQEITEQMAGKPQILIDKALQANQKIYETTKEGYSLWSKTWLYQLNWNDSIGNIFYTQLWDNPDAFNKSNLFSLEFIGNQFNQSLVTFKIGEKRTQEQIIDLALVRNVDKAFAKLQKKNDVFKPKTPVSSINPIKAKIGTKEGLSGGEKFDVLELTINKEGITEYKVVGSVTVDKKTPIWDNRYNAGEEREPQKDEAGNTIDATVFKGSKKIQVGMLLKQAK